MTSKELIATLLAIDPDGEMPVRAAFPPHVRSGEAAKLRECMPVVGVGYDAEDDAVNIYLRGKR
jgi:hypothetical protein